ncbi:hypothetical protein EMCRGX_G020371 [Ephydatia muelleri]
MERLKISLLALAFVLAARSTEGFTVSIKPFKTSLVLLVQCVVSDVSNSTLVNVTWLHGDKTVVYDSRIDMNVLQSNSSASFLLRVQYFTYQDAGNYTCVVQLPSMELQVRSAVFLPTLKIMGAPNVTSNTSALKVELRCEVSEFGLMAANLQWFKGGAHSLPAQQRLSVSDSGLYYCKLNGTDIYDSVLLQIYSTDAEVNVSSRPKNDTASVPLTANPPAPSSSVSSSFNIPSNNPSISREFFFTIMGVSTGCLALIIGLAVAAACFFCVKKSRSQASSKEIICPHLYDEVGPVTKSPAVKAAVDTVMTIEPCVAYESISTGANIAYSTSSLAPDNFLRYNVA